MKTTDSIQKDIVTTINAKLLDTTQEVLVEKFENDQWQGRNRNDKLVFFESKNDENLIGIFVFGRLLEMRPYRMPLNDSDMDIIKSAASFVSKHVENTKIIELQKLANETLREEKYILGIFG